MLYRRASTYRRLTAFVAVCLPILAGDVTAQRFTTLHTFTPAGVDVPNDDGGNPFSGVILSGHTLYGTTYWGGAYGQGTVYKLNTDGSAFAALYSFTAMSNYSNNDGARPSSGLVLSGSTLFGTAWWGGSNTWGTVFKLNTDGTGFATLHNFAFSDGVAPYARLVFSDNTLYGTTRLGGAFDHGTIFALNTDGTGFTNLHAFNGNPDGSSPHAGLTLGGGVLYGTTGDGGTWGNGTIFRVNTDGSGFTNLYTFSASDGPPGPRGTNYDGAFLWGPLLLAGEMLYGTAHDGGNYGQGTVFSIKVDGTGFTTLHHFTAGSDGRGPIGELALLGSTLYGVTRDFYPLETGTLFMVTTNGNYFATLHKFNASTDGSNPEGGLLLSGSTLYGTAVRGASLNDGSVFSLSFAPQLSITRLPAQILLSWPTNYAGFDYGGYTAQSTTNLEPSALWDTNSPVPVIVSDRFFVTNPISDKPTFFRLSR